MPKTLPIRRLLQLSVLGTVVIISGCTLTEQNSLSRYYDYSNTNALPQAVAPALNSAAAGQKLTMPQSPWGENAQVKVTQRYFAASGRTCLKLAVENIKKQAVVCQHKDNWVINPDILSANTQG